MPLIDAELRAANPCLRHQARLDAGALAAGGSLGRKLDFSGAGLAIEACAPDFSLNACSSVNQRSTQLLTS